MPVNGDHSLSVTESDASAHPTSSATSSTGTAATFTGTHSLYEGIFTVPSLATMITLVQSGGGYARSRLGRRDDGVGKTLGTAQSC
jgi:hypothetical protein